MGFNLHSNGNRHLDALTEPACADTQALVHTHGHTHTAHITHRAPKTKNTPRAKKHTAGPDRGTQRAVVTKTGLLGEMDCSELSKGRHKMSLEH